MLDEVPVEWAMQRAGATQTPRKVPLNRFATSAAGAVLALTLRLEAGTFMTFDAAGDGRWHDVNKSYSGDFSLCWAASAANLLSWGGWGVPGLDTDQKIYDTFVASWTDQQSLPIVGILWWLTGISISHGTDWAHVDVPGNGGYWPDIDPEQYYVESSDPRSSGQDIAQGLQNGYAISLAVYVPGGTGHALTVWGYDFQDPSRDTPLGIYYTDSDDYQSGLRYTDIRYDASQGWWVLEDWGAGFYHIGAVEALRPVPEPGSLSLLLPGLILLCIACRRAAGGPPVGLHSSGRA